jgi:HK97 family phage major capsid protein
MREAHLEMETLGAKPRLSTRDQARFDQLGTEFDELTAHVNRLDRAADMARSGQPGSRFRALSGSPGDDYRRNDERPLRDNAMRTLERAVSTDRVNARSAEIVENVMGAGSPVARTWTQRWTVATGSEAYERAFAKMLADPNQGNLTWTPEEADAWRAVVEVQAEQRSMGLTDSAGGYLVPFTLDPAVNITGNGSTNPLREIATVTQIVTDTWNGITSAGVTAEWIAESTEVADASPTLGQPSIPVHKADAFVPFSFEVGMDAANFLPELQKLLVDGYDQLTATAYTTGSGTGQPTGVITRAVASSGTVALVAPATAETLAAGDVYSVQNALPPRFQANAQWCANLSIINALRQFETTNGALKFPALQDNPPQLLGRRMNELSNMDGTINAAATENNYPLLYGDFGAGFRIIDRLGSTLEIVSHLFGSSRRPTGQRGALLWARTGSDVVIPNAFRLLSIPTTA